MKERTKELLFVVAKLELLFHNGEVMSEASDQAKIPTCFVIMPIGEAPGYEAGHFKRVYEHLIRPAIRQAGYAAVRADDAVKTDYIVVGIVQKILECEMVLCDLSARNPNVLYELGIRHAFDKPVVLIKDKRIENCFDVQGLRYTDYDESLRVDSVERDIPKLKAALVETRDSGPDDMNSIVALSGIRIADAPKTQVISPDTSLILSSITALEKKLVVDRGDFASSLFRFSDNGTVVIDGGLELSLEDKVYREGRLVGNLIDMHPADNKIFVRQTDGKILIFNGNSVKAKGLTDIPF